MEPPARLVWNSWEAFACIQDVEVSNSNRCYVHSKKNICAVCHACQIALLILWKESEDATDFLGVLFWQLQVRQVRRVEKARLDKMTSSPKPWVSSRKYHSQANGTIVTPNTLNRLKNYSGPLEWTQKLDCGRPQSNKQKKHTKNASTNKMPRNIWKDTYQSNPWYLCKRHPKMPPTEKKKKHVSSHVTSKGLLLRNQHSEIPTEMAHVFWQSMTLSAITFSCEADPLVTGWS